MVKFLGLADLFTTFILLSISFNIGVSKMMIIVVASYLFLKAIIFLYDVASILDVAVVILLVLSIFITLPPLIFLIAAVFLGIKGLMSLFA